MKVGHARFEAATRSRRWTGHGDGTIPTASSHSAAEPSRGHEAHLAELRRLATDYDRLGEPEAAAHLRERADELDAECSTCDAVERPYSM